MYIYIYIFKSKHKLNPSKCFDINFSSLVDEKQGAKYLLRDIPPTTTTTTCVAWLRTHIQFQRQPAGHSYYFVHLKKYTKGQSYPAMGLMSGSVHRGPFGCSTDITHTCHPVNKLSVVTIPSVICVLETTEEQILHNPVRGLLFRKLYSEHSSRTNSWSYKYKL